MDAESVASANGNALSWAEANQRHVVAAITVVRRLLERHAAATEEEIAAASAALHEAARSLEAATAAMPASAALDRLSARFELSQFEREVLLLCAAVEWDGSFAARLSGESGVAPGGFLPTFGVALAALSAPHWSALSPSGPLRLYRMIEMGAGATLASSPLRIDERVLHFLAGAGTLDAHLRPIVHRVDPPCGPLPESQHRVAQRVVRVAMTHGSAFVQLAGRDEVGKRAIASSCCDTLGATLYALHAGDIPQNAEERDHLLRLWRREVLLDGASLYLDAEDVDATELRRATLFAERVAGLLFLAAPEPAPIKLRAALRLDVTKPTIAEQRKLWSVALAGAAPSARTAIRRVVGQFSLGAQQIREVASAAIDPRDDDAVRDRGAVLWDACRVNARPQLDQLAQRIETTAGWNDLILPADQLAMLHQIAAQVQQRATVYEKWEFNKAGSRGLGISVLFSGASGTGKTLAAEVIAHELLLDVYRIDLSQVVSKYIGETEKNLRRIFDAAEDGGAVLLFDEADALFGKRSEVKDSHDRYANIEVSYLLQRMDTYRGLAILTTNLKSSIDAAFLRRLRFLVDFPFPDVAYRAAIWQRIFPRAVPTDGLDVAKLARLNVAGGAIYNIALNAAFLAAHAGDPVRMSHLRDAARSECRKLERQITDAELREWV